MSASLQFTGAYDRGSLILTPMATSAAAAAGGDLKETAAAMPESVVFRGRQYVDATTLMRRDSQDLEENDCKVCCSWLKTVGVALLILASVAAIATGVGIGLGALGLKILGLAGLFSKLVAKIGFVWSIIAGAGSFGVGVAGLVGGSISCCGNRAQRRPETDIDFGGDGDPTSELPQHNGGGAAEAAAASASEAERQRQSSNG